MVWFVVYTFRKFVFIKHRIPSSVGKKLRAVPRSRSGPCVDLAEYFGPSLQLCNKTTSFRCNSRSSSIQPGRRSQRFYKANNGAHSLSTAADMTDRQLPSASALPAAG